MDLHNIPIFDWPIDWSAPVNGRWSFDLRELAIGFGPEITDIQQDHIVHGFEWTSDFREEEIDRVSDFLNSLQGRTRPFWLPGPAAAYRIADGASSTTFLIREQGAEDSWESHPGGYLYFTRHGEAPQFARITGISDNGDGTETVTIEQLASGEQSSSASSDTSGLSSSSSSSDPANSSSSSEGDTSSASWLTSSSSSSEFISLDEHWQCFPLFLVRLADDNERIEVCAERWERRSFKVVEVPHEYADVEDGIEEPSLPVFLYRFTAALPDGDVVWRFTSHPTDLTIENDDWLAVPIEHGRLSRSTKLGGTCTISADVDSVEPLRLCVPMRLAVPLRVEILKTSVYLAEPQSAFIGTVRKPKLDGRRITVQSVEWGEMMAQSVPNFFIQRTCNYRVYDAHTCRADRADFEVEVTVASKTGRQLSLTGLGMASVAENHFAGGWIEIGSGLGREVLYIVSSSAPFGNSITVVTSVAMRGEIPLAGVIVPGCNGMRSTCISKFDNLDNFGGHATPRENLTLTAIKANASTGKK